MFISKQNGEDFEYLTIYSWEISMINNCDLPVLKDQACVILLWKSAQDITIPKGRSKIQYICHDAQKLSFIVKYLFWPSESNPFFSLFCWENMNFYHPSCKREEDSSGLLPVLSSTTCIWWSWTTVPVDWTCVSSTKKTSLLKRL